MHDPRITTPTPSMPLRADDDCFVAKNPSGEDINVLEQHITNLLTPATPYFFNTLYDPYRAGADFVRGYPFSLREGVTTAVSHGLWMNIPGDPCRGACPLPPARWLQILCIWHVSESAPQPTSFV